MEPVRILDLDRDVLRFTLSRLTCIAGACLTAAFLTACGGGQASAPIIAVPSDIASANVVPLRQVAPEHDIYVADKGNGLVKEIPKACHYASCVVTVGKGFSCPTDVSLDETLDVYVSNTCDYGTAVYKMAPGCNAKRCASTVPGDYLNPEGTASYRGNFYVADYSQGYVREVPSGCQGSSCVVTLGGDAFVGPGYYPWDYGPSDVTVDKNGNVYVASDYFVSMMKPNCKSSSCVTHLGGGWSTPWTVSLDHEGNIYVNDSGHKAIKEMPQNCHSAKCVSVILNGFTNTPFGAKVDAQGNVYVSDPIGDTVQMIPKGCHSRSCLVTIGGGFSGPLGVYVGP